MAHTDPGPLLAQPALHEIVADSWKNLGPALGFMLALLARSNRPGLWVRTPLAEQDTGQPYAPGLLGLGANPANILLAQAENTRAALAIMEEGLSVPALGAVALCLPTACPVYDLTTSRRLALRAGQNGIAAYVLRPARVQKDRPALPPSAAAFRWHISAHPAPHANENISRTNSLPPLIWQVTLSKSRACAPGHWTMSWTHETHSLSVVATPAQRTAGAAPHTSRTHAV